MSAEHKPPMAAFVVLALVAVLLVGYQIRAQAMPGLARVLHPVVVAAGTLAVGERTVVTAEQLRPRVIVATRAVAAPDRADRLVRAERADRAEPRRKAAPTRPGARPQHVPQPHRQPPTDSTDRQEPPPYLPPAGDAQGPPAHAAVHERLPAHAPAHGVRSPGKAHGKAHGKARGKAHGKARGKAHGKARGKAHGKARGKAHGKARRR